jgi:Cyclin-dependent kinase inhibitor 3 (CDKN3)
MTDNTKFNYGPVSDRDNVVCTCQRPGDAHDLTTGKIIVQTSLESWLPYIKNEQGVRRVLILFEENEMEHYDESLLEAYEKAGLKAHWEPLSKPSSYGRIMAILDECFATGERITAHCTGGTGRSGRVAAGWLMHKYHLSDKDATMEVLACATAHGVSRLGSVTELNKWIAR